MYDIGYKLEGNDYEKKRRGITVAKTYVQAGVNARKIAPPLNIFLGSQVPDLSNPAEAVSLVRRQLPKEQQESILAIAFLRETHVRPQVRLGRIGAIVIDALNRPKIPIVNPVASHMHNDGIAIVRQRHPESSPQAPRHLPASTELHNVIILPVFNTPRQRHLVTDVLEVVPHIYAGLHEHAMETIINKSDLE